MARQHDDIELLRSRIADAVYTVKSYNLPVFCTGLGLRDGDEAEAHASKRLYVEKRLDVFDKTQLLDIAASVLSRIKDPALSDLVSEMTRYTEHRISELTRRDILKLVNNLETLFGDCDLHECLSIITDEPLRPWEWEFSAYGVKSLEWEIAQHYQRNNDLTNEDLLIKCGALTCSQTKFFALLEKLLDPVVRRGAEQEDLASSLSGLLRVDGFKIEKIRETSGHPVFAITRLAHTVAGSPKNLIFASINVKPELYFTDAINNDIAISNDSDALIYDEVLPESGLTWEKMVAWWAKREGITGFEEARASLYQRLLGAVKATKSPGELLLFKTYYEHVGPIFKDKVPALVPQVYLHYDPRTMKNRGNDRVLLRQRMDFLLLLQANARVVIEVDGSQHYSEGDRPSPRKYAEMVSEDRRLKLSGYELYRFGGAELNDAAAVDLVKDFFYRLLKRHEYVIG